MAFRVDVWVAEETYSVEFATEPEARDYASNAARSDVKRRLVSARVMGPDGVQIVEFRREVVPRCDYKLAWDAGVCGKVAHGARCESHVTDCPVCGEFVRGECERCRTVSCGYFCHEHRES